MKYESDVLYIAEQLVGKCAEQPMAECKHQ